MAPLPTTIESSRDVDAMLSSIVRFTSDELPFLASIAQLALQATCHVERAHAIESLYRLSLDHCESYVTDLADELLCWIERDALEAA